MTSSLPERTVESWLAVELELWFPGVQLWAPTQNAVGNWDVGALGAGKLLIFECKGCEPLVSGHSIPIDMSQLWRYAIGPQFVDLRDHVFYVLPAPPWAGAPPAIASPFPPVTALPAAYAANRIGGTAGGCWMWFHVVSAPALWGALTATSSASINTRRLPNPPTLGLPAHTLGPLAGTHRLGDFLDDVARCLQVPLTGTPRDGSADRDWTRPKGREGGQPPRWPGGESPREPPPPVESRRPGDQDGRATEATPIAAFIPVSALAV